MIRALVALAVAVAFPASATAKDRVHVNPGFNGYVTAISGPAPDGTRYLGGTFSAFNAVGARGEAVVSAGSGEVDRRFPQVVASDYYSDGGGVKVAVPDGAGGWFIGGKFETVDDTPVLNAAHIRGDGSLDPAWRPDPDGEVVAIALSGSTVYIGGAFKNAGGASRKGIAAIGADGALAAWNPQVNGAVASIAVAGSIVYFGGSFTKVGTVSRLSAAAVGVDGAVRSWNPAPYIGTKTGKGTRPALVATLAVSGSVVYMGGWFDHVCGRGRNLLAAVGTDGLLRPWNPKPDLWVNSLKVDESGIYVGGAFTAIAGQRRFGAARFGTDGTLSDWNPGLGGCGYEMSCTVNSIARRDGVTYLAGDYESAAGQRRSGVAAFAEDGHLLDWNPHPRGGRYSRVIAASDSGLYLSGDFTAIGGESRSGLAALDAQGRLLDWNPDLPMEHATSDPLMSAQVTSVALADSAVYVGMIGEFEGSDGEVRYGAAAVGMDGKLLPWRPRIDGGVSGVESLEVAGSTVYLGGDFTEVEGHARSHAAAVSTDGRLLPWNPRVSDDETSIILPNGVTQIVVEGSRIYLAGDFAMVGGKARQGYAAVNADGTVSDWNPRALGAWVARYKEWTIRGSSALAINGSSIYLVGDFAQVQGKARNGIAAVDTDGKLLGWYPKFGGGEPVSVAADSSGVYVGGYFTTVNGQARSGLAAIDQSGALIDWAPSVRYFPDSPSVTTGRAPEASYVASRAGSSGIFGSSTSGIFISCAEGTIDGRSCDGLFRVRPDGALDQWGVALTGDAAPDRTAPSAPRIAGGPAQTTSSTEAIFSIVAGSGVRVTCGIDGSVLQICGTSKSYTALKPGRHTFCVRVVDESGVQNVTTRSWTITKPKNSG